MMGMFRAPCKQSSSDRWFSYSRPPVPAAGRFVILGHGASPRNDHHAATLPLSGTPHALTASSASTTV